VFNQQTFQKLSNLCIFFAAICISFMKSHFWLQLSYSVISARVRNLSFVLTLLLIPQLDFMQTYAVRKAKVAMLARGKKRRHAKKFLPSFWGPGETRSESWASARQLSTVKYAGSKQCRTRKRVKNPCQKDDKPMRDSVFKFLAETGICGE